MLSIYLFICINYHIYIIYKYNTYYLHSIYTFNTKQQLVHITSGHFKQSVHGFCCMQRSTHTGSSLIHNIYNTFA